MGPNQMRYKRNHGLNDRFVPSKGDGNPKKYAMQPRTLTREEYLEVMRMFVNQKRAKARLKREERKQRLRDRIGCGRYCKEGIEKTEEDKGYLTAASADKKDFLNAPDEKDYFVATSDEVGAVAADREKDFAAASDKEEKCFAVSDEEEHIVSARNQNGDETEKQLIQEEVAGDVVANALAAYTTIKKNRTGTQKSFLCRTRSLSGHFPRKIRLGSKCLKLRMVAVSE
ncbi:unnamed protein product [Phytophthora lilii]|uniref:Unnamed protein product n=1 Tax=Phytophthora lilii TaxID=2077276 RepID=A0A9W6WZJ5_9STRA|nr:unnamed protein product [Phytophthora lilii]